MLHQDYKDLLLKLWENRGRRDVQIYERFKESGQLYKHRLFLIHRILRTRKARGKRQKRQYLVEWARYAKPTWQDGKTLPSSLIRDFYRQKRSSRCTIQVLSIPHVSNVQYTMIRQPFRGPNRPRCRERTVAPLDAAFPVQRTSFRPRGQL
jgi:hypothetical protein